MFKLSERQHRFVLIWLKNFIVFFSAFLVAVMVGAILGYAIIELIHIFGLATVLISLFCFWALALIAAAAAAFSESELSNILEKEHQMMERLKRDFQNTR